MKFGNRYWVETVADRIDSLLFIMLTLVSFPILKFLLQPDQQLNAFFFFQSFESTPKHFPCWKSLLLRNNSLTLKSFEKISCQASSSCVKILAKPFFFFLESIMSHTRLEKLFSQKFHNLATVLHILSSREHWLVCFMHLKLLSVKVCVGWTSL